MVRKPFFWIVFVFFSIICTTIAVLYFSSAFPIVNVDLETDRNGALEVARKLSDTYRWGPPEYQEAASFGVDSQTQNYVELEAGGIEAFSEMIQGDIYSPYTWAVRHFKEGEANETVIWLTPSGQPYGFSEKLPEEEPGPSLSRPVARAIAEDQAQKEWSVDLDQYTLVEESDELRIGGRTDHTFVYERTGVRLAEAKYRLRLTVGGNRFVELRHFIKIPEEFSRKYEEMRSSNDTIAVGATIAMGIIYILGGCIIGLFFLLRQHWVQWKQPLFWGSLIGFLQILVGLNQIPISWMGYDTALSSANFLFQQVAAAVANGGLMGILMVLSFMAAESLGRKAFPHHIQLWKLWSKDVAPSSGIVGQTAAGYLMIGIFFAYEVGLYFATTNFLGWWSPSSALFEPDLLATYFPWLTSIAISAQAGFWEESLFRAVPIAGAALLGQRYGNRKIWIIGALILQAVVFGAGHANYPAQPAYARLVELIIPSIAWGLIYINFGLLPAVVLHFAYDVVWFALPLFVSTASGIWIDQLLVVILALIPAWVIIFHRFKRGRWTQVPDRFLNGAWKPRIPEIREEVVDSSPTGAPVETKPVPVLPVLAAGLVGLILWVVATPIGNDALPLETSRSQAVSAASADWENRGFQLPEPWQVLSTVEVPLNENDRFVWEKGGKEAYRELMGNYLGAPYWKVRIVRFEGDVAERAEEFETWVDGSGEILRSSHRLPESREGAVLSEEEARMIAVKAIEERFQLNLEDLVYVSSEPSKLENRQDWTFTYRDENHFPLNEGEARISVVLAGDEVADAFQYVYIPEEWEREERSRRTFLSIFGIGCSVMMGLAIFAGSIVAIVNWSRRRFRVKPFLVSFSVVFSLSVINVLNNWPNVTSQFSTAQPFNNQMLIFILGGALVSIFLAAAIALNVGLVHQWNEERRSISSSNQLLKGLSIGAFLAGVAAVVGSITAESNPQWADYSAASALLPVLAASFRPISSIIMNVTVLLLILGTVYRISSNWTARKTMSTSILVTTGIVIAGMGGIESITYWLISGLIIGAILLSIFIYFLRDEWELIPVIIAVLVLLTQVKNLLIAPYPGSLAGGILAVIFILTASLLWSKWLTRPAS